MQQLVEAALPKVPFAYRSSVFFGKVFFDRLGIALSPSANQRRCSACGLPTLHWCRSMEKEIEPEQSHSQVSNRWE
jgi:hypothetical protein